MNTAFIIPSLVCLFFNLALCLDKVSCFGAIANKRLSSPLKATTQSSTLTSSTASLEHIISQINSFEAMEGMDLGTSTRTSPESLEPNDMGDGPEMAGLIEDIDRLTLYLGNIIRTENPEVYNLYEELRNLALARSNGDANALGQMIAVVEKISPENALGVTRAFTQTLNLINAAEVHNRMRRLRDMDSLLNRASPLPLREDSVAGTIRNLLDEPGQENDVYLTAKVFGDQRAFTLSGGTLESKKQAIFDALLKQKVDIVLTAHPTEVNRRTLLRKYRSISEILALLDRKDYTAYERLQTLESLRRQVGSIWGSDEIRRVKPTPQQEANGGLAILESVIWDAVPAYLRKLDAQCQESLGRSLPLDHVPIKFSSWMGGDRDGNPNVTPTVTHEVATNQRMQAARLLLTDIEKLYAELAICKGFSEEMLSLAREVKDSPDRRELYRRILGHLRLRLLVTIRWCEAELLLPGSGETIVRQANEKELEVEDAPRLGHPEMPLFDSNDLFVPLRIMHDSLCLGGYADVADGLLVDAIRRVTTFGLTMVPLDIRQESGRHMATLDAITRYLGIGSYATWDEDTKLNWLQSELNSRRPLFRIRDIDTIGFDPTIIDCLRTFEVASQLGPGSLGAYVISQGKSASDVLAVMLLQKQFGMTAATNNFMRVVPLFETLEDLTNSDKVIETLFSMPTYLGSIKGKQEIMVGYSDSAKDAGRLAAGWVQYIAQENMVKVAERFGIDLTFFHGKGGTVGRGGNPALYRAVLAHPPKTINGKFRVTEQGEMITQNFGSTGIAERTLDIYTAAVLAEKFVKHIEPKSKWRQTMEKLSSISCASYRSLIEQQRFISYFRTATPERELGTLNIGSRPAKRNPKGGIESLRAIPWQFAWTQTRLHFPAWMGIGQALDSEEDAKKREDLRSMYDEWPFFKEMVDLIAMTLSKTDFSVSANYEMQLIGKNDTQLSELGVEIRNELIRTRKAILTVTGCSDLSNGFQLLKRSMKVRNPYVDPLNVLQAEMMKRLRTMDDLPVADKQAPSSWINPDFKMKQEAEERGFVEDTLVVTINGIAQGMKNSG